MNQQQIAVNELELLRLREQELELELELRERNKNKVVVEKDTIQTIQPHDVGYATAYPLRKFTKEAFKHIYRIDAFRNNWHIDAITELLQEATLGNVKKFIINIPRRCSKSTLICVCWFTWSWTFLPHTKWLYNSYSGKFALRDSNYCKTLLNTEWYRERFGHKFNITKVPKGEIHNNKGGYRQTFKVGGGTGEGGDFIIADDPNSIDKTESYKETQNVVRGWREVAYSNYVNAQTVVRGIIQQRTSPMDLTAHLVKLDSDYEHLCLPMEFEEKHPHSNSISKPFNFGKVNQFDVVQNPKLKIGEDKIWIDPRNTKAPTFENNWFQGWYEKFYKSKNNNSEGQSELLWKDYLNREVIDDMKKEVGIFAVAGQLQQRPTNRSGNFFNAELFNDIRLEELYELTDNFKGYSFVRYVDKAGTQGAGDLTVMLLMCRSPKAPYQFYIIDVYAKQVNYYNRMADLKQTLKEDTENYINKCEDIEYTCYIEKERNASGSDMTLIELDELAGYPVESDLPLGSKGQRAKPCKFILEGGRYTLVKAPWNQDFKDEIGSFNPNVKNQPDNRVDTWSGGTRKLQFGNIEQPESEVIN